MIFEAGQETIDLEDSDEKKTPAHVQADYRSRRTSVAWTPARDRERNKERKW